MKTAGDGIGTDGAHLESRASREREPGSLRIGMLCHNYAPHPGGIEVVVRNLGRRLARSHEVTIVTAAWAGDSGASREDAMEVHRLPALHLSEKLGIPYPFPLGPGIARALRALAAVDILHAHGALYPVALLAAALSSSRGIPLVLTEHVGFVRYPRAAVNALERVAWRLLGDRVLRRSAAVTTYNERIADWLRMRWPGCSPRLIRNGVDTGRFGPLNPEERRARRASFQLPQDQTVVLFAGRDNPKKNLDVVLRIPRESFQLAICGHRRDLRGANLTDLGLLSHEAMADLYGCADLLVHAATGEGFPLVVQEALACGLPVVLLWDDGYLTSIDRDAVVACTSFEELSQEVRALAVNAERRASLSARARTTAIRLWSWDVTASSYLQLYRECLDGFRAGVLEANA